MKPNIDCPFIFSVLELGFDVDGKLKDNSTEHKEQGLTSATSTTTSVGPGRPLSKMTIDKVQ